MQIQKSERNTIILGAIGLCVFLVIFFQAVQTNMYQFSNHLFFHTLLELASIAISLSIFIYGWLTYPISRSRLLLSVSLTFLAVAIFDIIHTFSYPGMPFSISEHSQTTAWFWIIARLTEALILLTVLSVWNIDSKVKHKLETLLWFGGFSVVTIVLSLSFLSFPEQLPILLVETGPTSLKNGLEYVIAIIHVIVIYFLWSKYKRNKNQFYLNLIRACYFLILCGLTITLFATIYDVTVIVGHIFKVIGYFFIMKAFYYSTIQVPLLDKKQTEDKLLDVESELELLFKNTEDAIFIYELNTKKIIRRNPAFTKMFGDGSEKVDTVDSLIPLQKKEEFEQLITKLKQGQSIVDFKTVRQRQDHSLLDVSMTVSPMKSNNNEVLCAAIIRDVSKQIEAEQELKRTKREFQEIIEQYQGVIFKFKKEKGRFVYTLLNGKIIHEKGKLPELLIGLPVEEMYDTKQESLLDMYNERAWQGEEVEFQFEDTKGASFLASLKPIIGEKGQIVEVMGTAVDITKLIKTEELLRRTEKLSVVGELAAGFAHEIRNPLTTLKGFLQLIKMEADSKNKEYVSIMLNEIDRLEMITNEFMVVAKPQVAKYEMGNIEQIIENVILFLQPQAILNSIEMKTVIEGPSKEIYCDKHQLRQVFINMYKNAMEAMPNGGMIVTKLTMYEEYVSIEIIDEGSGIPEDLIPKLGEPFYTLKEKGTGLGLMVSKKIIESHQGTLQVESRINVGTTMKIELPVTFKKEESSNLAIKEYN
ncbi:ATP-binding protein [Alkalihalobacillus sp. MEB130]|uniref:MASE3 domain-containing protein n=1 Tax=Alkalihalobacillus sp. MEB130 TaxID=2976704 RepID=UPI0028DFCD4A|nr:MASE3 domain-containing protein [Alkalihalobacillus sp. MEB130]MDT8862344.1 ATP-binding protein [Alkalihalobacillus sp. MEB130]